MWHTQLLPYKSEFIAATQTSYQTTAYGKVLSVNNADVAAMQALGYQTTNPEAALVPVSSYGNG
jgi:hypothetical protein